MPNKNSFDPKAILDDQVANQMLDNILRSYSVAPNAISLEVLQRWGKYKRTDFRLCQWLTGVLLTLLLLVPLLFIPSTMKLSDLPQKGGDKVTLNFAVDSLLPVFRIDAAINGRNLPVVLVKYNHFTADVTENGDLAVTITLVNGRSTYYDLTVNSVIIDKNPPVITNSALDNNQLTIFVTDEKSDLDLASAYAIDDSGNKILPLTYDNAAGTVVFPYNYTVLNLFIADVKGNQLQAVVTSGNH